MERKEAISYFMGGLGRISTKDVINGMFIAINYLPKLGEKRMPFKKEDFESKTGYDGVESKKMRSIIIYDAPHSQEIDNNPFTRAGRILSSYDSYELGVIANYLFNENTIHMFPEEAGVAKKIKKELDVIFNKSNKTA